AYSYSSIQDIIQCPICLECFKDKDPRVLPCQHVFCYSCIPVTTSIKDRCIITTCPVCQSIFPFTNSSQFPKSYTHIQLCDLVPINYDIKGKCSKCKQIHLLNLCPCCDCHLCGKCFKNDRENALIHLETIIQIYENDLESIQTIQPIEIPELLQKANILMNNNRRAEYHDILLVFYRLKYLYEQFNKLPVVTAKRTYPDDDDDDEDELERKHIRVEQSSCLNTPQQIDINDDDDDSIIYKNDEFNNQNQENKEKRPFLRKRQGLAHYQAPPKRRQPRPKTNDSSNNSTKNENVKRSTSASSTNNNPRSTITTTNNNNSNQRSRSQSSTASAPSGRQTPTTTRPSLKTKPTKQINSSSNTAKPSVPISTQSNLLGKVDLDDEDDLLTKYQTKKLPNEFNEMNHDDKFITNLQTMIDTKWNTYKTSFHHSDDEQDIINHDDDDDEDLYTNTRHRTSSRSSGIQSKISIIHPKKDLDDFEKLEQYAEEHPSMISTASYVEKVVFKDHHQTKTADIFVNRLTRYHEQDEDEEAEVNDSKHEEVSDLSINPNRIRQRKVIPFKNKVNARIEQLVATAAITSDNDDDDDDEEDDEAHKWDDIGVAKIIPVIADEYNSDSGISSFKTDFPKLQHQQQQKKDSARSSDFGDDHSWADRVNAPQLNSLMLNTFPGLRHTVPTSAPLPPPPPPPPQSVIEPNQDYSRLVREKAKELEKQIELFEKENGKLQSLCNERNSAIKKLKQDRDDFEKMKQKETEEFNQMKDEEMKKLKHEKRLFEQHRQQLRDHPDKREREEIETLKKQVLTLQEDLKQRETRWSTTINRLKERIETLEYENAELKQEKDIIERKRLDLMHQLQTISKNPLQDDTSSSLSTARKSIIELSQPKQRPKSTVPTTSKTQSLPKTMVIRNSEPSSIKPKINTSGRRTPTTTTSVGVNGIKNNIDTSRKLSSLPATKRPTSTNELSGTIESIPIPTLIEQPLVISERADSGNGESDEDFSRFDRRNDDRISPSLSSLINSEYPKTFITDDDVESNQPATLDYKSLLNMATRTSSSATTLLKRHQETLSLLDQPTIKRQPLTINNNDSTNPTPRLNLPLTTTTTKAITFKENLPTSSNDGIIEEIRHNDGRIERIKPDQSKQIIFPNGSKQDISADGRQIRVQFYNGDYKEKLSDGRCVYRYASTNTTETEYPDGTRICEFPNGQIEKHLPDGRQEHILPDKTKNIYLTDGTIISIKTNGEKLIQHPDQTKEVHTDTYKRKLFPNGSILTVFNTGEQEIRYANGKIKIKDAHGNIIMEKKAAK
ncbi:unnamed protein product, partial [Adineta steineri]